MKRITDKDFGSALESTDAARIRGKIGVDRGNKYIQSIHNNLHGSKNSRKCGYD
tara:strand:+ start:2090 stop:2251 length:162 start_codon:yes stop_codon:yes gene_type:complete